MARNRAKKRNRYSDGPSPASSVAPSPKRSSHAPAPSPGAPHAAANASPGSAPLASADQKPGEKFDCPQGEPANVGELRSDPPQATAQDDALHDEFFRQGEQIDKENVAAQAAAANWQPSEAPPHDKSIAPRWDPKLTERQRRLRHLVASVLAPAAILAAIAAAKHLDATSAASTGPVSPTSAELSAARLLAARASQHALSEDSTPSLSASEPATRDDQHAAAERDRRTVAAVATADAQQGKDLEGAAPAPTSSDVANTPAAADGVNTRKAAVRALNQGRWDDALSAAYAALAQEPTDATLYLYAGTALQEKGRGEEARKVFRTCLQQAKRGPIHECRVFAR